MAWTIRAADVDDRGAIVEVVSAAFTGRGHDAQDEVDIVVRTWELGACPADLELVAAAGEVVGHVMAGIGDLSGRPAIGIAPLSVAPEYQGQGVGTALMTELLRRVEVAGWPFALLLGDPAYYARFSFEPAEAASISYAPVGAGNPHFMLRAPGVSPGRDARRIPLLLGDRGPAVGLRAPGAPHRRGPQGSRVSLDEVPGERIPEQPWGVHTGASVHPG